MNKIPTIIISLKHKTLSPSAIDSILRKESPPVVGRIKNDFFIFDMRTIFDNQIDELVNLINKL